MTLNKSYTHKKPLPKKSSREIIRDLPDAADFLDGVVSRLDLAPTVLEPGEFTAPMIQERTGQNAGRVNRRLAREYAAGRLTWRRGSVRGRAVKIYKAVDG